MKAFKKAAGLLLLSYIASVDAHKGQACQHGKHDIAAPIPHYIRSTLEDLDLAAGNSPFTGKPHTYTREIKVTTGPDGKRVITGGTEEDFKRFFETDAHGMPHPRGSDFGRNDPFGGRSSFGRGSLFGDDPFGADPFGRNPHGGSPFGRPTGNPNGPRTPAQEPSQREQEEMAELLRKLKEMRGRSYGPSAPQHQPAEPEVSDVSDEPEVPVPQQPKPEQPKTEQPKVEQPKVEEPASDDGEDETNGAASWRDPLEDFFKRLGKGQGGAAPKAEPLKMDKPEGSFFRIIPDYRTVNTDDQKMKKYITESLMPSVIDYFTHAIKLKYPNKEKISVPDYTNLGEICDGGIDRSYVKNGPEGDLVILVRASNAPREGYVARATSCVFDSRSGRTILSSINFNLAHVKHDNGNPLLHAKNVMTTLHELTHVLGFSNALYSNFLLPNGQPNRNVVVQSKEGDTPMTMINVEPLTSKLRKHFGCDRIQGAPLENEGGAGSAGAHFERRIFFNEYMTASEVFDGKISEFSLALLEGTGWYVVDYSMAEPFHVGQGQGCDYFFGKCMSENGKPNFSEFCAEDGRRQCSNTYNGVAVCDFGDQFGDGCGLPHVQDIYDCRNPQASEIAQLLPELQVFGPNAGSKCFMGDLVHEGYRTNRASSYCLNYKCNGTGATTTLDIIVGKSVVKCEKAGKVSAAGFSGKMHCPDPVAFCSTVSESFCPRGCMGRGQCVSGKCQCKAGFKGEDCAYTA